MSLCVFKWHLCFFPFTGHSGNLFTHVTFDGYYAPRGFVLDGVDDLFFVGVPNTSAGGIIYTYDFVYILIYMLYSLSLSLSL